jgi:molybdate transport system substrate-binding protein
MRIVTVLTAAALALAGCGDTAGEAAGDKPSGTVVVFAAASLKESFTAIGKEFEAANPGVKVTFNFGASSTLAQNITQGAPADVFAAASPATMKTVTTAGDAAGEPAVFVRNQLQIAVPTGNPAKVTGLPDFAKADLKIALCAKQVPCGAAADKAFAAAGITPKPDTLEQDVKATLTKVVLGEVDAALVYRTDVRAAGDKVEGVDFPEATKAINDYPIVTLKEAPNAAAARTFVDFVRSEQGRAALTKAGFTAP